MDKIEQYEVNMMDEELMNKFLCTYDQSENTRIYFTDGSETDNGGATRVGFVIQGREDGYQIGINKKSFVFHAKLLGIDLSLESTIDERVAEDIPIPTDSKSTVETIANNNLSIYKNELAPKIGKKINRIVEKNKHKYRVIVAWIPGRKDIQENENADEIAKKATQEHVDPRIKVT